MTMDLTPERALIFRITHRDNVPWILEHGLHCRNSNTADPNFISIGNPELIGRRHGRRVLRSPYGTLSDYVPFYFTPLSPMLYNIKTGWGGIRQRKNEEIVILASSIPQLITRGVRFLFTDRHAYLQAAQYFSDSEDLIQIDWPILRERDFQHDAEDPDKKERYQAEALAYKHVPTDALLGIVCYKDPVARALKDRVAERGLAIKIIAKPGWYF